MTSLFITLSVANEFPAEAHWHSSESDVWRYRSFSHAGFSTVCLAQSSHANKWRNLLTVATTTSTSRSVTVSEALQPAWNSNILVSHRLPYVFSRWLSSFLSGRPPISLVLIHWDSQDPSCCALCSLPKVEIPLLPTVLLSLSLSLYRLSCIWYIEIGFLSVIVLVHSFGFVYFINQPHDSHILSFAA